MGMNSFGTLPNTSDDEQTCMNSAFPYSLRTSSKLRVPIMFVFSVSMGESKLVWGYLWAAKWNTESG